MRSLCGKFYPTRELQRRTQHQAASRLLPHCPLALNVAGRLWDRKRLHFGSIEIVQAQYMIEQAEVVLAETFLEALPRTRRLWNSFWNNKTWKFIPAEL
jgi:hypothetical protein